MKFANIREFDFAKKKFEATRILALVPDDAEVLSPVTYTAWGQLHAARVEKFLCEKEVAMLMNKMMADAVKFRTMDPILMWFLPDQERANNISAVFMMAALLAEE